MERLEAYSKNVSPWYISEDIHTVWFVRFCSSLVWVLVERRTHGLRSEREGQADTVWRVSSKAIVEVIWGSTMV